MQLVRAVLLFQVSKNSEEINSEITAHRIKTGNINSQSWEQFRNIDRLCLHVEKAES